MEYKGDAVDVGSVFNVADLEENLVIAFEYIEHQRSNGVFPADVEVPEEIILFAERICEESTLINLDTFHF